MGAFLRNNALSVVMFVSFLLFLALQSVFGWHTYNETLAEFDQPAMAYWSYLGNGHFIRATFENWESEFLQMAAYVLLTVFLVQRGSPESHEVHPPGMPGEKDEPGMMGPESPKSVRRGGLYLKVYENSLTIALAGLFALSFVLHLLGGTAEYNQEQSLRGEPGISIGQFLLTDEFWFQSMQNWQSEFLSVGALIVLSVFLRQRGSSQSKQIADPHRKTGP